MNYWVQSVDRVGPGVYDVEIGHGERRSAYRFTIEYHEPFHLLNADRHYMDDFLDEGGDAALPALREFLMRVHRGESPDVPFALS